MFSFGGRSAGGGPPITRFAKGALRKLSKSANGRVARRVRAEEGVRPRGTKVGGRHPAGCVNGREEHVPPEVPILGEQPGARTTSVNVPHLDITSHEIHSVGISPTGQGKGFLQEKHSDHETTPQPGSPEPRMTIGTPGCSVPRPRH